MGSNDGLNPALKENCRRLNSVSFYLFINRTITEKEWPDDVTWVEGCKMTLSLSVVFATSTCRYLQRKW